MTTPAPGPACDLCQDEPAVMSMMNLSTYDQLVIGVNCLVPFHLSQIQQLTGMEPDMTGPQETPAEPPPAAPQDAPEPPAAAGGDDSPPAPAKAEGAPRAPRRRGK